METIRNYLEAMFAEMPNTPEVLKAKDELLQMMEDKYSELIAEGVNENEAIGQVLSEFGNLDEISEALNLKKEVEELKTRQQAPRRFIDKKNITEYLGLKKRSALFLSVAVALCIISSSFTILFSEVLHKNDNYGIALMFVCIAVAVGLFIANSNLLSDYKFMKRELCQIDIATADYVAEKKRDFMNFMTVSKAIGVVLCAFCWLPTSFIEGDMACVIMFYMIGAGVMLLIYGDTINKSYITVLNLNDINTVGGRYGKKETFEYSNAHVKMMMEVFWPTVICLYICVSFLTCNFAHTLIVFPVAFIFERIVKTAFAKEI